MILDLFFYDTKGKIKEPDVKRGAVYYWRWQQCVIVKTVHFGFTVQSAEEKREQKCTKIRFL